MSQRPQRVGSISLQEQRRKVALSYDPAWLQSGFALSEDLPLHPGLHLPPERDSAAGAVDGAHLGAQRRAWV